MQIEIIKIRKLNWLHSRPNICTTLHVPQEPMQGVISNLELTQTLSEAGMSCRKVGA